MGEGGTARLDTAGGAVTIGGAVTGEIAGASEGAENLNINATENGDVTLFDVDLNNVA